MKRMLVVADSEALWTKRFIEHIPLQEGYEIVLFPIWGYKGKFDGFYREHGVIIYQDEHSLPVIRHIPRVRMWARLWLNAQKLARLGPFDVVHTHYISQRDLAMSRLVARRLGARWAASIWGSDLLRASAKEQRRMARLLQQTDAVHVNTQLTADKVIELCGGSIRSKLHVVDFGQVGYDCIDAIVKEHTKAECKEHFGIDPEQFVLCIGYSASSAQQQYEVLQAMSTMPEDTLRAMTVVLQQTYCMNDPAYVERTRQLAATLPCRTVVLTEFMSDMECAWLRLAADAFILSITTDAISGTLREYLYAGACVLKGGWLDYPPLRDMGIEFAEFDTFDEIPALLMRVLSGELRGLPEETRALFHQKYSWKSVRKGWLALYE